MTHHHFSLEHETGPPWPSETDRNVELWELTRVITMAQELNFRPAWEELRRRACLGDREAARVLAMDTSKDNNNVTSSNE